MNTEELLKSKNITYKISGADLVIRCLNPEHEDNNPSMRVDKLTGKFNCLSCGFGGNIFKYYNVVQNQLDVRILSIKQKIKSLAKQKLAIPLGAEAFNRSFRNISAETYNTFGAFIYSGDKDLENRVIFPLYDINGDIVCFQGRSLYTDVSPKYINKPKGVAKDFFPIEPNMYNGSVILVEGIFDMLNLYDKGITNAVSSLGLLQAKKGDIEGIKILEKLSILKLQGVTTIYIMYDGDKAGIEAANKLLPILRKEYIADIVELPDGTDPGSMTKTQVNKLKDLIYENSDNR